MSYEWILQFGPLGGQQGGVLQTLLTVFFYVFFFAYMLFGQQIQSRLYLIQIDGALKKLDVFFPSR